MKSNDLTTVNNKMILARSNFSVPQKRIITAIVQTISPHLKNEISKVYGKEISLQVGTFNISSITYKASDLSRPDDYKELRKALKELREKSVYIETKEMDYCTGFLHSFKFAKRSETVELLVDIDFYNLLLDYNKEIGYTEYETNVLMSFTSIYAMRMYEILAKWRNKNTFYQSIEELRRLTDTLDKYPQIFDWKKRVLDVAKMQMDSSEISDLKFTYSEKKKGKSIIGFTFSVIKTKNAHEEKQKAGKVSLYWDFTKSIVDNFSKYNLILKGKNLELVKTLVKEVGEQKLSLEMDMIFEKAKDTANPQAYMIKSLKNYLQNATKEPVNMTVDERKKHAENARKGETDGIPKAIGDLFKTLSEQ